MVHMNRYTEILIRTPLKTCVVCS